MELVSANTKDFMYMTMSQYNELETSVPARVRIRRDQPFWQGGNSYLACEAFRITCSPSQDGLYYKRIPNEWYIQARRRLRSGNKGSDAQGNAYPWVTPRDTQNQCINPDPRIVTLPTPTLPAILSFDHKVSNLAGDDAPPTKDPATLLQQLGAIQQTISSGQEVRVSYDDEKSSPQYTYATVVNDFMGSLRGRGFGPKGLYFPQMKLLDVENIDDIYTHGNWNQLLLHISVPCPSETFDQLQVIKNMFGGPLFAQNVEREDHTMTTGSDISNDPLFEVLMPEGLYLEGNFPATRPQYGPPNNGWAKLNYKVYWKGELKVGTHVTCEWRGLGGPYPAVSAIVAAIPDAFTYQGTNLVCKVRCQVSNTVAAAMTARAAHNGNQSIFDQWNQTLALRTVLHRSSTDWTDHLYSRDLEVQLPELDHDDLRLLDFKTLGVPTQWLNTWDVVSERRGGETLPDGTNRDVYTYTPNGFCNFFNSGVTDRPNYEALPYNVQCDVNGGFAIEWSRNYSNTPQAWTSFCISRALHNAMGLNDYFEWWELGGGEPVDRAEPTLSCVRVPEERDMFDRTGDSIHGSFQLSDLFELENDELVPLVVPTTGKIVYTVDRAGWIIGQDTTEKIDKRPSTLRKVFPTVHVAADGIEYLKWSALPNRAMMRNNQKVSIESFQTFNVINLVVPNLPFQPMLGTNTDERILASLRIPFPYNTGNSADGSVKQMEAPMMGDLLWNSDDSRSYLKITTDQELYDVDVEARLLRRDGSMEKLRLPYQGQFQVKLRFLEVQ